jgi:hypothetical protein
VKAAILTVVTLLLMGAAGEPEMVIPADTIKINLFCKVTINPNDWNYPEGLNVLILTYSFLPNSETVTVYARNNVDGRFIVFSAKTVFHRDEIKFVAKDPFQEVKYLGMDVFTIYRKTGHLQARYFSVYGECRPSRPSG